MLRARQSPEHYHGARNFRRNQDAAYHGSSYIGWAFSLRPESTPMSISGASLDGTVRIAVQNNRAASCTGPMHTVR